MLRSLVGSEMCIRDSSDIVSPSSLPKRALSLERRKKLGKLASLFQFMDDADQFVDDGESEEDVLVEVTADFDEDPYRTGCGASQSAPSKSSFLRRSTIGSRFEKEPNGKPPAEDPVHPSGVSRQLREFELQQHDIATRGGTSTRNVSTMSVTGRGAGKQQFDTPTPATPRSRSTATASTNMSRATTTTTTVVKSVKGIERFRKDPYAGVVLQRRPRGSTPHGGGGTQSVTTVDDISPSNRSKLITRGDVLATCGEDSFQQHQGGGGDRNGSPISVYSAASTSASHHIKRNVAFPVRATAVLGTTTHPSQDVLPITYQEERMLVRAAYHNQKDKKLMRASTSVAAAADVSSSFIMPDDAAGDGLVDSSSSMPPNSQPTYTTLTHASMGGERGDTGVVDDGDDEDFPLWLKDGGLVPTSAPPMPRTSRSRSTRTGSKAFNANSAFSKAASGLFGDDDGGEGLSLIHI
eukprot:TRINITY_DN37222_c0_g1_i2.p1 TRINITY_DN37222_c0_g1~~TRINITY_DN37222_c0_g1_i2.p1  ORF type:complete len:513 (-),score=100.16 TRINITY_DN37222_c0_g1_i2:186-1583(-)